jgi:hypothetical protein
MISSRSHFGVPTSRLNQDPIKKESPKQILSPNNSSKLASQLGSWRSHQNLKVRAAMINNKPPVEEKKIVKMSKNFKSGEMKDLKIS